MPELSVIIPTYRDWARLRLCLDALAAQTLPPDRFEVVVANNDPAEPEPPYPLASNVRVVVEGRPGSYAARNGGVATCSTQMLAFTDSDCVPDPQWLQNALRALEARPDARVSGRVSLFREEGGGRLAHLYEHHTAFRQRENAERGHGVTANLVVSRATFDRVGPFDASLLSGGDYEWHGRAQRAGVPILYADDAVVRHPARARVRDILLKRRRTARSEAQYQTVSIWDYAKWRVKPPLGRIAFDRGTGLPERALMLGLMWSINLYAVWNFALVRAGVARPVRK